MVKIVSSDVALSKAPTSSHHLHPLFSLEISNCILLDAKKEGTALTEAVNHATDNKAVTLDVDCARLQTSLRVSAGEVATKVRNAKRSREHSKICNGVTSVMVNDGEVLNTATLEQRLKGAQGMKIH